MIAIGIKGLGLGGVATAIAGDTIEEALFYILGADATIDSLVDGRIYPNAVPQGKAMPAITYQQISGPREYTTDGPVGLVMARYQVNCWTETYAEARQLGEAVRLTLNGYIGTIESLQIYGIFLENEGDLPSIQPGVDRLRRFAKYLDFTVCFKETIA